MCADFGDCCPDYQEVCGTAFADECEDREASVSNQAGKIFTFDRNSVTEFTELAGQKLPGLFICQGFSSRLVHFHLIERPFLTFHFRRPMRPRLGRLK